LQRRIMWIACAWDWLFQKDAGVRCGGGGEGGRVGSRTCDAPYGLHLPRTSFFVWTQVCVVVVVVVGDGVVDTKEQCKRLHGYLASLKTRSFVGT
jgi:hypothetical protein